MFKVLSAIGLSIVFMLCGLSSASAEEVGPDQVVKSATSEVMVIIEEAKAYYDKEPQRYFEKISSVLDVFVDFDDFSKAVMAGFADPNRLAEMPAEKRARTNEQIERFGAVFKAGLVQTYGKGFLAFGGEKIEVADSRLSPDGNDAKVLQLVYGIADEPYKVMYDLRKNSAGNWKLRNVVIGGINLGKIYRSQFLNAAKKYNGDIDQVIDNWVVEDSTPQ